MQITTYTRHFEITESIKQYVEENLPPAIEKYFPSPETADVTFFKNGSMFDVEIKMHLSKRMDLVTQGVSHDAYAAFDEALEHASKKIRRHKRKLTDHHHQHAEKEAMKAAYYVIDNDFSNESLSNGADQDLFLADENIEDGAPVIVAEHAVNIQLLDVANAVMNLDVSGKNALLFKNSSNKRLSMVYIRPDGNIGWIEPELD